LAKEPATFQRPTGGQFEYNDWLQQQDNEATIQTIGRELQPSQELMPFQRKFRHVRVAQSVAIGEVPIFTGEVPRGEIWVLHRASAESAEGHTFNFNVLPKTANPILHTLGNFSLEAGVQTPLYPARWRQAAGNNERFNVEPGKHYEFIQGDSITFRTSEVAVGVYIVVFQMLYEIVPSANEIKLDEEFASVAI